MEEHSVAYKEYIRSDAWRAKRQEYFAKTGQRACYGCGAKRVHVHHKTYERMGHEEMGDLVAVCESCHALIHERHRLGQVTLRQASDLILEKVRKGYRPPKVAKEITPWKKPPVASKKKLARLERYGRQGCRRTSSPSRSQASLMAEYARIRDAEEQRQKRLRAMR